MCVGRGVQPFGPTGLSNLALAAPWSWSCYDSLSLTLWDRGLSLWGQQGADTARPLRDTFRALRERPTEA